MKAPEKPTPPPLLEVRDHFNLTGLLAGAVTWGLLIAVLIGFLACTKELILTTGVEGCTWTVPEGGAVVIRYDELEACVTMGLEPELLLEVSG